MVYNFSSECLSGGKKRKGCFLFLFPRGRLCCMFLFWTCLLALCKYISPTFLCFLARGSIQSGSHMVVKLGPNEVFCFIFVPVSFVCLLFFSFFLLPFLPHDPDTCINWPKLHQQWFFFLWLCGFLFHASDTWWSLAARPGGL